MCRNWARTHHFVGERGIVHLINRNLQNSARQIQFQRRNWWSYKIRVDYLPSEGVSSASISSSSSSSSPSRRRFLLPFFKWFCNGIFFFSCFLRYVWGLEVGRLRFLKSTIELCMNGELEIPSYSAPSFYWFYSFAPLRKKKKKLKLTKRQSIFMIASCMSQDNGY